MPSCGRFCALSVLRIPLKIHFYEIVNNTSQYDVSVQALLEYGDISSPEEFVTQRWPIPPVLATSRSCSCSVLDNFTSPKQFLEVPLNCICHRWYCLEVITILRTKKKQSQPDHRRTRFPEKAVKKQGHELNDRNQTQDQARLAIPKTS